MGFGSFIKRQKDSIVDQYDTAKAERQADRAADRVARSEGRQLAREERAMQIKRIAVARETQRGKKKISMIRSGTSQFGSFMDSFAGPPPSRGKRKKGKKSYTQKRQGFDLGRMV